MTTVLQSNKLSSLLNIEPGEGKLVGLMLLYALLMGIPTLVVETTAYALFLAKFDANAIPYVYIGFTIVTTLSGLIYTNLGKQLSFVKFMTLNLLVLTLSLLLFRLLLLLTDSKWPVMGLAIWYEASWALANLGFWAVATHLLNVRQAKRLFALIGIGLTLSEVGIGFFIPMMVRLVGTPNLLLIAAAAFGGALVVQTYIFRTFSDKVAASDAEEQKAEEGPSKNSFATLFQHRYIQLIFLFSAFYALSYYTLDNLFYSQVDTQISDSDALASFLGIFFAVAGLLTMIIGAFASGQLITRYGVGFGLLVMPASVLLGVGAVLLLGTAPEVVLTIFWFIVVTKLLNEVLAYTINRAAWQVLYEPLPANLRLRTQTVVESMVKPLAGGLAGGVLLLLNSLLQFQITQTLYFLLFILTGWITVLIILNKAYLETLLQAIVKRRLSGGRLLTTDSSSVAILEQNLNNPHVGAVIYSLNMLEEIAPKTFPLMLQKLLRHPVPGVRRDALDRIERLGLTSVIESVRDRVTEETVSSVRGASLRVLAALGGPEVYEEVSVYLADSDPQVRLGAMVGLLRNGHTDQPDAVAAHEKLYKLAHSLLSVERKFAAQVIGEACNEEFCDLLLKLIRDEWPEVQQAALNAAGKLKSHQLWPSVAQCLAWPKTRTAALKALAAGGEAVMPTVEATFAQIGQRREVLIRLARICGRVRGEQAISFLEDRINFPDEPVRFQILSALNQCAYRVTGNKTKSMVIEQRLRAEIAQATWNLAAIVDIGYNERMQLLRQALENNLTQRCAHIFLLLSFIYDSRSILQARDTLTIAQTASDKLSDEQRAYALEIIDMLLASSELKPPLLTLLDDCLSFAERLRRLNVEFPQQPMGSQARLEQIITRPDEQLNPWTKACALYAVAQQPNVELAETVVSALSAYDPLVRETAIWTLFKLGPEFYRDNIDKLTRDTSPQVIRIMILLEAGSTGDKAMLSTLEKVILLKSASFFSETPEDVLVEVASILEEIEVRAGQTIIQKGEPGSSMYIVVDGRLRVHNEEQNFTLLHESDVFGELSLLDPGPRSASVTAIEDARLLRLDQEPFYELIDDYSAVARKIMQNLVRDLREARNQALQHQAQGNQRINDTSSAVACC